MKIYTYIKILSILGISLALYLLWQQIAQPTFRPCSINAVINCDAIISGPVAKTFGIPTPLYGLLGYITLLIAAFFQKTKVLLITATLGLIFCLSIGYIELVQLRVVCPICITCQLIMITIFSLSIKLWKTKSLIS